MTGGKTQTKEHMWLMKTKVKDHENEIIFECAQITVTISTFYLFF